MYKTSGIDILVVSNDKKLFSSIRRVVFNSVRNFDEISSSLNYLKRKISSKDAKIIITTFDDEETIEKFESFEIVESILIYSIQRKKFRSSSKKLIGIFLEIDSLIKVLPELIGSIEDQLVGNSLLFHRTEGINDNPEFYFYPLIQNRKSSKKDFVEKARRDFKAQPKIRDFVEDFRVWYRPSRVLQWLNRDERPFPFYLMINNGLRTQNENLFDPLRFFIDDLVEKMRIGPEETNENLVYFGTKISKNLAKRLENFRRSDVVAFQCFFWANLSRYDALTKATKPSNRDDLVKVLFKIRIDNARCLKLGDRYFIETSTPFRIDYVTFAKSASASQPSFLTVKLFSIDQNESEDLYDLYYERKLRQENRQKPPIEKDFEKVADQHVANERWNRAVRTYSRICEPSARVLNKLGQLYRDCLNDPTTSLDYHQQALEKAEGIEKYETLAHIGKTCYQLKEFESSLRFYQTALEFYENEEEKDLAAISRCLIGLSNGQRNLGEFDEALKNGERALDIRENQIKPVNEIDVSGALGTLSNIFLKRGENEKALIFGQRSLEILEKYGPQNSLLAAALNNLGAIFHSNGDEEKARDFYEKALKALPRRNFVDEERAEKTLLNWKILKTE